MGSGPAPRGFRTRPLVSVSCGAPADSAGRAAETFRSLYTELGGSGSPRVAALFHFSLGDEHTDESLRNLRTYYANLGEWSEAIAQGASRSGKDLPARVKAYEMPASTRWSSTPQSRRWTRWTPAADVVFG